MAWKLVAKKYDPTSKIGVAVFQKPKDNDLYNLRKPDGSPPFCEPDDKPDAAWYLLNPLTTLHLYPDLLYVTASGGQMCSYPLCVDRSSSITLAYVLIIFQECDITGGDIKEVNR
jgi:hypothetical protein